MRFRVTIQYGKSPEDVLAEFKSQTDAESFIKIKVSQDAVMKMNVMYRLYDSLDLIKEFDASKYSDSTAATKTATGTAGTSGGAGQTSSFRPTPFNTTPAPKGLPRNWLKDDDKEKDKDK